MHWFYQTPMGSDCEQRVETTGIPKVYLRPKKSMTRAVDFVGERFDDLNEKAGVVHRENTNFKCQKQRIVDRRFDFKFKSNLEDISI